MRSLAPGRLLMGLLWVAGFALPVQAQLGTLQASLRTGHEVEAEVREVTAWGFWLRSGEGLLFRQILSLTTASDTLVRAIERQVPAVRVEQASETYTLYFEGITFPARPYRPRTLLTRRMAAVGLGLGDLNEFEVQFLTGTTGTGPMIFQIGHAIGPNGADGFLGGFTFGAGIQVGGKPHSTLLMLNFWKKYFEEEGERVLPKETFAGLDAFSGTASYLRTWNSGLFMTLGMRYYFTHITLQKETPRLGVLLMVGAQF